MITTPPPPSAECGPPRPDASPAERLGTRVDGLEVIAALSPSRAGDFLTCPLMYRLRTIDRLPEDPSPAAVRGTVVHKVLEDLFDLPAVDRIPSRAADMLVPAWEAMLLDEPEVAAMFDDDEGPDVVAWLASCREVLQRWFSLEDPQRLEPAERELYVETLLDSRLLLRGFVDRVDVAPDGRIRIVDYKTGSSPPVGYEAKALFQMKFYALVIWRTRGVLPSVLQLVYLGNGEVLRYEPDEADLLATERKVQAIWDAIRHAEESGDWQERPSRACDWCSFKAHCPAYGGTPPPLPQRGVPEPNPSGDLDTDEAITTSLP